MFHGKIGLLGSGNVSNDNMLSGTQNTAAASVEHQADPGAVMDLARYPTLAKFAKDPQNLSRWLDALADGLVTGQIRNVVYNDAKDAVSRVAEHAWRETRGAFFYNGRWEKLPLEVQELDHTLNVYGLYSIPAAYKRLTRSKLTHPAVVAMRDLVVELLPLAEAVAGLKAKIVKGRAPSTGPSRPENPNKVVKTCPCCFRQIAVVGGTMAHHGYERPGHGWQTASCAGIRFKPLEVSNEGLVWLISVYQERLSTNQAAWKRRDQMAKILVPRRTGVLEVTRDMPEWDGEFRIWCAQTESEIRSLQSDLKRLNKVLAEWKPEEPA